jgi:peroxiredoxin
MVLFLSHRVRRFSARLDQLRARPSALLPGRGASPLSVVASRPHARAFGHIGLAVLALAALLCASCGTSAVQPPAASGGAANIAGSSKLLEASGKAMPQIGDTAPDFEFTLADGTTRKLSDLRGKKVLLNFWASWCGPCREEMPDIQKATQTYGDKVAVLGVNQREPVDIIASFENEIKVNFQLVANQNGDIAERYRVSGLPVSYFINTDGTIGARHIGVMDYATIQQLLDRLK